MNQLQNVFTAVGAASIALPQLVVVGSQSSGKSSVLEHIVGRDFLPRGTGIVTRRPLILQLTHTGAAYDEDEDEVAGEGELAEGEGKHAAAAAASSAAASSPVAVSVPGGPNRSAASASSSSSSASSVAPRRTALDNADEYGVFGHLPNRKFYSFDEIRAEIVAETDRVTGGTKNISAHPINLQIFSPHVLNLTMVDLPGITKVALADQPPDIEQQILNMILSYISSPHSLIIAVSQANADLANSDSLKLAREVDPSGIRTLGVLTKIDLMDRGTDAMQVLVGNSFELQHGFVGVVCRSQEAIMQGKPIRDALAAEKLFFANHPVYRSIASRLGTPFLARKLSALLMMQIQSSLPDIRNKISSTIQETTAELESYGSSVALDADQKGSVLLPLISHYCANLSDALDGRSPEVSLNELYGGARISYLFREVFAAGLDSISPLDLLSDHDIRISIRNASGTRPALFIPEIAFELLVKKQIERLLQPSLDAVELVFHELQRVALQCEQLSPELIRFPQLRTKLLQVFQRLLKSCVDPTKAHIEKLIQCELSFINTSHPDFIGGSAAVALIMDSMQQKKNKQAAAAAAAGAAGGAGGVDADGFAITSKASTTHARASSAAPVPLQPTAAPATLAPPPSTSSTSGSSSSRHANQSSSFFSLPSIFGRSPSPSANKHQPGSTASATAALAAKRSSGGGAGGVGGTVHALPRTSSLSTAGTSGSTMEDHELYSGGSASGPSKSLSSASSVGPSYLSAGASSSWHLKAMEPTERDLVETAVIKALMESYFRIVRKSVADLVPKTIMYVARTRNRGGDACAPGARNVWSSMRRLC